MNEDIKDALRDLSIRINNISERTRNIEVLCAHMQEQIRAHIEVDRNMLLKLEVIVTRHENIIFGNSTPGMKTRIDRLEQKDHFRQWHLRSLWVAFLALVSKVFYDLFFTSR